MRNLSKLFFIVFCCLSAPALAEKRGAPMVFSRADVEITHAPTADKQTVARFSVEVRSDATNLNPDWFRMSGYEKTRGLMVWYSPPQQVTISPINEFAAKDVLFLDIYGNILQIAPKLVLAEMQETIVSEDEIQAVLYLSGGICEQMNIKPGDKVRYKLFQKKPVVIKQENVSPEKPIVTKPEAPAKEMPPSTPAPVPNSNLNSNSANPDLVEQILRQHQTH